MASSTSPESSALDAKTRQSHSSGSALLSRPDTASSGKTSKEKRVRRPSERASQQRSKHSRTSARCCLVLGGAVRIPGSSYVNYIVPAVFVEAVLIGGMTTS